MYNHLDGVPADWDQVPISELGDIVSGGTPSRGNLTLWNGGIPWVTPGEIGRLKTRFLSETNETISEEGLRASAARLLPPGSLLVTSRATIGATAIASVPVTTNQGFKSIVPNNTANSDFYYYLMDLVITEMDRRAVGSTFKEISKKAFESILVQRPLFDEQAAIAKILDTMDAAIEHTERVIKKLKRVKAGMLHDLLIRGIDENGELRDPVRNPGQFQESPFGLIPKDWSVETIRGISHGDGEYGAGASALPYDPFLPRYVRITDICGDGGLDPDSRASITRQEAAPYLLKEGDLLFARSGATVGKTHLYTSADGACAHAGYVIKFSLDIDQVVPEFIFWWTQSSFYWSWVQSSFRQGAQPNINGKEYGSHHLVKPLRDEQGEIAVRMQSIQRRIVKEAGKRDKFQMLKCGLMQDLLTGRRRVGV